MPSNSLERAIDVLEMINQSPGGLTHSEISRRLDIPKSSCTYLLQRLEGKGIVVRKHNERRYRIGPTLLVLAFGALRDMGFRSATEPALYKLVSETGLSATITILERYRVLVVDRVESPNGWISGVNLPSNRSKVSHKIRRREQREIGRELLAHSNASGKVLLAYLPEEELRTFISTTGLKRSTSHTIVSKEHLLRELQLVKKRGYAVDCEEQYVGVFAVACPIADDGGTVHAAVTVDGNATDADWSDPGALLPMLQEAARDIGKSPQFKSSYLSDLSSFHPHAKDKSSIC